MRGVAIVEEFADSLLQASNSMFSTTSNIWTMLFSVCFLGERINPFHVIAVVLTMTGLRVPLVLTIHAKFKTSLL